MALLETFEVIDDDGVIVIARSPSAGMVAEPTYPETLLDEMRAAQVVAFETGYEDTFVVRVRTEAPEGKKKEQRGPFAIRIEEGERLVATSYGEWTRGETRGGVALSPGTYDVVVRGVLTDGTLSFDVHVTPRDKPVAPKRPKQLPTFATDPLDVHPVAVTCAATAQRLLATSPTPVERARAEQFARIARKHYASLGKRGARAVAFVDAMFEKHGLSDGPIDVEGTFG